MEFFKKLFKKKEQKPVENTKETESKQKEVEKPTHRTPNEK